MKEGTGTDMNWPSTHEQGIQLGTGIAEQPAADSSAAEALATDQAAPLADPAALAQAETARLMAEQDAARNAFLDSLDPFVRQSVEVARQLREAGAYDLQQTAEWLHDCHPADFPLIGDARAALESAGII